MRFHFLLPALLLALPLHASEFSSLEERMSASDFRAAGLEKLSPAELAALNVWLRQRNLLAEPGSAPIAADTVGFRGRSPDATGPIESRIVGPFQGWSGRTEFVLENGQVWRQQQNGSFYANMESPRVTIRQGLLGDWQLQVEGSNRRIGVERIR